jgi:hypothetical protein
MSFNNNNKINRLIAIIEDLQGDITNIQSIINTHLSKSEAQLLYQKILQFSSPLSQPTPYSVSIDLANYYTKVDADNKIQTDITNAINNLVDTAPASMNTLKELATALNNDALFSTTILNNLATKQALLNVTDPIILKNNNLSIDLSSYQQILTATSPLSISNNNISITMPTSMTLSSLSSTDLNATNLSLSNSSQEVTLNNSAFIYSYNNLLNNAAQIYSLFQCNSSGFLLSKLANNNIVSLSLNSSGINLTTNELTCSGKLSLNNVLHITNSTNTNPLTITQNTIDICNIDTNGKINCNSIQTNQIDGIQVYSVGGITKNAEIKSTGEINSRNFAVLEPVNNHTIASINEYGQIDCTDIICDTITINGMKYYPPIETVRLNCANPSQPIGTDVNGWSFTWTNTNGRNLKISAQITCYTNSAASTALWYLMRRRPGASQSVIQSTGKFLFNNSGLHLCMPTIYAVDISRSKLDWEYYIRVGANCVVDQNDTCTMVTTEYF